MFPDIFFKVVAVYFEQCSHINYNNSKINIRFLVYDEIKKGEEEVIAILTFKSV